MSVLDSVLTAIRGKRQEQAKTIFGQYFELVDRLARGEQVDVDELAIVLDTLDKSDKDLAADVAKKQRRFELAGLLSESRSINASIHTLETKHEAAVKAKEQAIARLQPVVEATYNELNSARHRALHLMHAEPELLATAMDPEIPELQASLDARRKEVADELYESQDRVLQARQSIRDNESRIDYSSSDVKRRNAAIEKVKQLRDEHEPLFARFNELKAAQSKLDAEQVALNARKLIP